MSFGRRLKRSVMTFEKQHRGRMLIFEAAVITYTGLHVGVDGKIRFRVGGVGWFVDVLPGEMIQLLQVINDAENYVIKRSGTPVEPGEYIYRDEFLEKKLIGVPILTMHTYDRKLYGIMNVLNGNDYEYRILQEGD